MNNFFFVISLFPLTISEKELLSLKKFETLEFGLEMTGLSEIDLGRKRFLELDGDCCFSPLFLLLFSLQLKFFFEL